MVGGTALAVAWFAADLGDRATQVVICWLVLLAQNGLLMWFCHRVVRLLDRHNPAYRFWWTIRGASVVFTVGSVAQLANVLRDPYGPTAAVGGAVQSSLLAIGTGWIVLVMLRYPRQLDSAQERIQFWLDIATVVAGVAAFAWFFAVPERGFGPQADLWRGLLLILQGPVALLVAGFAVAKLLLAGKAPFSRVTGVFGGITALVNGVARGLGPVLADTRYANLFFGITVIGPSVTLAGVLAQERYLRCGAATSGALRRRPYSTLPYVALAATYALLIVLLLQQGLTTRTAGVLVGAIACMFLVVIRQLAAFTENARLLGQLRLALGERDTLADALRQQAFHDTLTGLANRALLTDRLDDEFRLAHRQCRPVVVMLIDLDDFKPVNDRLGHHAGDLLLRQVARRLRQSLQNTDTVARFGGDEFAILLCRRQPPAVAALAERILADLDEPFLLVDEQVRIHASLGVAIDPDGSWGPEQILRNADAAMYAAKRQGKGTFKIFEGAPER
ncbi:MAG TPA: GGDEF domain-containing protein [Catenuloplanes sp.]